MWSFRHRRADRPELLGLILELVEVLEAVAVDPGDAVSHAVDVGVVLGARQRRGVLLDGDDLVPALREREGDGVATGAAKRSTSVRRDENLADANSSAIWLENGVSRGETGAGSQGRACLFLLGDWFWSDPEPSIVGHLDIVVVVHEDGVSLVPVPCQPVQHMSLESTVEYWVCLLLLDIPGYFSQFGVVMALLGQRHSGGSLHRD